MDFKEEYKNAAEELTPTRAQIDRMKANVISEIRQPKRNRFLSQAVYIGGTVAACAVITVTAVALLPQLKSKSTLTTESRPTLGIMDAAASPAEDHSTEYVSTQVESFTLESELISENAATSNGALSVEADTADNSDGGFGVKTENGITSDSNYTDKSVPVTAEEPLFTTTGAVLEADIEEWEIDEEFDEAVEVESIEGTNEDRENPGMGDFTGEIADETMEYCKEEAEFEDDSVDEELPDETEAVAGEATEEVAEEASEDIAEEVYSPLSPTGIIIVSPYTEIYLLFGGDYGGAAFLKTENPTSSEIVYSTDTILDTRSKTPYTYEFITSDGSRLLLFDMSGTLLGEYIKK